MFQRVFKAIATSLLAIGSVVLLFSATAGAVDGSLGSGLEVARPDGVPTNLTNGDNSIIRRGINLMLYAIAVISVVMLIFGGFRYVISGGQKEAVTAAKNTILYAIVGLLIAIFAYSIVRFVIGTVIGTDSVTDI